MSNGCVVVRFGFSELFDRVVPTALLEVELSELEMTVGIAGFGLE